MVSFTVSNRTQIVWVLVLGNTTLFSIMGQRDCDISRRERREPVHRAARGPGLQGCGHSGLLIRCWASLEPSDSRSLSLSLPCWQLITLKVASASRLSLPSPSFIQRFFPGPGAPDLSLSALQALTGPPAPQPPASRASPAASSSCLISLSASSEEAPHDSPVSPGGSRGLQEAPGVTLSHRPPLSSCRGALPTEGPPRSASETSLLTRQL